MRSTMRSCSCPTYGSGLNRFQVRIWYDKILWDPIVILPTPASMNHHQWNFASEFQHFMLRCNKISLLCRYLWKKEGMGVKETGDFPDTFSVCRIPCHTAYFLELALKRFHPGDFPWKARRTAKGRRIWEQPRRRGKRVPDGWSTMIHNCLIESLIAKIRPFSSSVGAITHATDFIWW